jgi:hypothetical protein
MGLDEMGEMSVGRGGAQWGRREGIEGERDDGGDVTNVQYKTNQNCHYEFQPRM